MARGNGTGPWGQCAMTGRGAGFCAGFNQPGFASGGQERGMGAGQVNGARLGGGGRGGRGLRRRNRFFANPPLGFVDPIGPEAEITSLRQQAENLAQAAEVVQSRIAELEKATARQERQERQE